MRLFLTCALCLLLTLTGCQKREEQQTETDKHSAGVQFAPLGPLFADPVEPQLVELPTAALPLWRTFAPAQPTLVLLSFDPMLQPIPEALEKEALDLAHKGSAEEIRRRGSFYRPDPALIPPQTLSAALAAGFFSRVIWVFPSTVKPELLSLDFFRTQMTEGGFFTEKEAKDLGLLDGGFYGTLRGVPFQAVHPDVLPTLEGPLVVHLDLGYFRGLYRDAATTPPYDLLHQTATLLRQAAWSPLAVTLSYSTEEGVLSLETRFVLSAFAELLRRPELLEGEMPEPWALRAEAHYGAAVLTPEKQLELYRRAAELAPGDGTFQYDLHRVLLEAGRTDEALNILDRAVTLDGDYAQAYVTLAQSALADRNGAVALALLEKARAAYPLNPFPTIQQADLLKHLGKQKEAAALLRELKKLPWSPVYHPEVPDQLKALADQGESRG